MMQTVLEYVHFKDFGNNFLMTGEEGQINNGERTWYIRFFFQVVNIWDTRALDTPKISAKVKVKLARRRRTSVKINSSTLERFLAGPFSLVEYFADN